jgi:large subunit ribosomal protein L18
MIDKKVSRLRRAKKTRIQMRTLGKNRLVVNRSSQHIYAQIISPAGDTVLASAGTVEKELRSSATGNATAAAEVGKLIAERAKKAGVEVVAFDRSGFKYHGRVKALAEAARENGLKF